MQMEMENQTAQVRSYTGNRFFNPRLYLDGIKQLRLIGIMAMAILELEAIILPLGLYVDSLQRSPSAMGVTTVNLLDMHPLLCLCFLLFAPVMTLYLFSFLNRRNSSDFYHALPCSRVCVYLSFIAAILTWITAAILITTATSVLGFSLLSPYCEVSYAGMGTMVLNMFAGSVYVTAAVALAMCLSGTLFTNLVVSFLLIFLPRILMTLFTGALADFLYILSPEHMLPPLADKYNVVTNLVIGVFFGNARDTFTFLPGGIYTLCLGAVLLALGALAFRRRRSESAGQSAPNRVLQAVYRVLLGFIVCLIPCFFIVQAVLRDQHISGDDMFNYAVLYLIAVLVCLLYELITTRKWRNLLRALPSLAVLAGLNVLFVGGLLGGYYTVLSFHPDAEDIVSVRLIDSSSNYYGAQLSQIELDDPAILQVVADRLEEQTNRLRQYPNGWTQYGTGNLQTVAIRTQGRTVYRRLPFTSANGGVFEEALLQNEEVRRIFASLPEPGKNGTGVWASGGELSPEQCDEVYESFRREASAMAFEDWYRYVQRYVRQSWYDSTAAGQDGSLIPGSLSVTTVVGTETYSLYLPLTREFPETAGLYMAYVNGENALSRLGSALLHTWKPQESLEIVFMGLDGVKDGMMSWSGSELLSMGDELEALLAVMEKAPAQPDIRSPLLMFELYLMNDDGYSVNSGRFYCNLPADEPLPDVFLRWLEAYGYAEHAVPTEGEPVFTE